MLSRRHYLLPALAGILWGTVFPALKLALNGFSPLEIAFLRALVGALTLGLVYAGLGRWQVFRLSPEALGRLFILSLAGAGFFWPVQTVSVAYTTSLNSAFLVATYPILVAALAPAVVGEIPRRGEAVGLLLAGFGAYLIISGGRVLGLFASQTLRGDGLALLASCSFASYILLTRKWSAGLRLEPESVTLYTFALSLPHLLFLTTIQSSPARPGALAWGAMLWLGVVATAGGFLALNLGLRGSALSRSAVHLLLVPLVAAVLSFLLLREELTLFKVAGGALILTGILVSNWQTRADRNR